MSGLLDVFNVVHEGHKTMTRWSSDAGVPSKTSLHANRTFRLTSRTKLEALEAARTENNLVVASPLGRHGAASGSQRDKALHKPIPG
jgi:acetylglutamate kinase